MARQGLRISYERFLTTFGQCNNSILRQWLGEGGTPKLIQRIGETKEALCRQHVRFSWRSLAVSLLAEVKPGSSFPSSATSRFAGAWKAVS